MDKKLKITIEVDSKTKELKVVQGDFDKLTKSIHTAGVNLKEFDSISTSIAKGLAKYNIAAEAFIRTTEAIKESIRAGIQYNASIEQMKIGIASLLAVQKKAAGVNVQFADALAGSTYVLRLLKKANLETSATLQELTQGFQAALAPAMQAGLTIKQTVEYTKLMTQAAGAMGVPMNQLAQELKSVVSGTIDLNSVVATNLGITNEQIKLHKKQGDLFEFLKKKLEAFAMAGDAVQNSFSGAVSNMEDAWSELVGEVTKPAFDALKEDIKEITKSFKSAAESVHDFLLRFRELKNIDQIDDIRKKIQMWQKELKELDERAKSQPLLASTYYAEMNQIRQRILEAQRKLNELKSQEEKIIKNNTNATKKLTEEEKKHLEVLKKQLDAATKIVPDNPIKRLNMQYKEMLEKYKGVAGAKLKIDKWYHAKLEKLQKEQRERENKEYMQALAVKEQAYLVYLETMGKKEEAFWLKEGKKINELLLQGLDQKQALEIVQAVSPMTRSKGD